MLNLKQSKNSRGASKNGGFTLVELLVTMVIFVVLTGVVIVNQGKFNSTELLNNFTYDIALTIKQAQSYGINVQENVKGEFNSSYDNNGTKIQPGYGVYFNIDPLQGSGGSFTNFILFNDLNGDSLYDAGNVTLCPSNDPNNLECVQKYSIKDELRIKEICLGTNKDDCGTNHQKISIIFKRPKLEANIYDTTNLSLTYTYARITLIAPDGSLSYVVVTGIGQIYVQK